ncbi:copper transporter [Nocardiopsis coralliicola]
MIDFRYHLVSIVAVFLALTVGLALGTTMLQDPLLNTLRSETSDLREQSEVLRVEKESAESFSAGSDALAAAAASDVLDGRLEGADVVLFTAPGADEELPDSLQRRIEQAGGTVHGRIAFNDSFADARQATFVEELTDQLADGVQPQGDGPYERAGWLLAEAVSDDRTGEDGEEDAEASEDGGGQGLDGAAVLSGFSEAGLVAITGSPADSASSAVLVAPPATGGDQPERSVSALLSVAGAVDAATRAAGGGTVLAGPPEAAGPGGAIARARTEDTGLATADAAGRPAGDVAAVLAVAAAADGGSGHFGVGDGAEGFVPDPLPERHDSDEQDRGSDRRSPPDRP